MAPLFTRISLRPRQLKLTLAPLVALATTVIVSVLGIHALMIGANALQSALGSAASAHELETIAAGVQGINGNLYHVLTLRGAQVEGLNAAAELQPLVIETDRVAGMLRHWADTRATPDQRVRVSALIDSVERYKGAVDFVSQMLDVDFVAAVSFVRPFDQNFHDLMQSLDSLVHDVQARERSDADDALTSAIHTTRAFEAVVAGCILIALLAAANMRLAAVRSQRLARQNSALTRLTQIDPLTGLANRRCFDDTLQRSWQECLEKQAPLCLVMFDVDHFKKFNDSQGHQAGDSCLRQVAAAVVPCTRGVSDLAARYGGEEFAVIMPSLPLAAGRSAAERIRLAVLHCAIPHPAAGPPGIVTISIGVASLVPTMAGSPTDLIEAADRSLYAAKRAGRNRVGDVVQGARPTQAAAPRPAHSESQHHD